MKGQTIIELKDINTGEVEKYVEENMMTNAIADYFKTGGLMNKLNVPPDNLVRTLLGGVILLDQALPENADLVFPPATANMTGNAVNGTTSNDDITEMGSYNSSESGWQSDGSYVQVFDFSTSQANGTIACVCLSSRLGAYTGLGNQTSKKRKNNVWDRYEGSNETYQLSGYELIRSDYQTSTIDVFLSTELSNIKSNKKITVTKYLMPLSRLNLKGTLTSLVKLSETIINIPDEYTNLANNNSTVRYDSDGNMYIYCRNYTWDSSNPLKVIKINAENVIEVITLQNTLGVSITTPSSKNNVFFEGGYMVVAYNNKFYRIALSDSSSMEMDNYLTTVPSNTEIVTQTSGRIFLRNGMVINVIQGTTLPVNTLNTEPSSDHVDIPNSGVMSLESTLTYLRIRRKQEYIASINNLENPVTKTADKTMKITYRIMF